MATMAFGYLSGVGARHLFGIAVVVHNRSDQTLHDVVVSVRPNGESRATGDLGPNRTRRAYVWPVGESSIFIQFSDEHGRNHEEMVAGYVGKSDRGRAIATIVPEGQVLVLDDTFAQIYWRSWYEFFR